MNPWIDFLVTVVIRFAAGFAVGGFASFVLGFRKFMRAIAESGFPLERVLLWGAIGGVICMFTTPRDSLPWVKG